MWRNLYTVMLDVPDWFVDESTYQFDGATPGLEYVLIATEAATVEALQPILTDRLGELGEAFPGTQVAPVTELSGTYSPTHRGKALLSQTSMIFLAATAYADVAHVLTFAFEGYLDEALAEWVLRTISPAGIPYAGTPPGFRRYQVQGIELDLPETQRPPQSFRFSAEGIRLAVQIEAGPPEREVPDFEQQFPVAPDESLSVQNQQLSDYRDNRTWGFDDYWLVVQQGPSATLEHDLRRASIALGPERRLTVLAQASGAARAALTNSWPHVLASAIPIP